MDLHEAITESRENLIGNFATEPCVVKALLSEIDRQSEELAKAERRWLSLAQGVKQL